MPITSSAKKALRQTERRRLKNLKRRDAIVFILRKIKKLVAEGKKSEAKALLPQAYKAFDKAAQRHVIHKNAAANKKSRLAQFVG